MAISASSPFLRVLRNFSLGTRGFFGFLGSIGDLKQENEKLMQENNELLSKNAELANVGNENQLLRQQLDLAPRKDYDLEASFVIGQDPQGINNFILIDKGSRNGIEEGMPAIVSKGTLVGKVSEVYEASSKVLLTTDPQSTVNAEVENSGARGIVKGEYGLGIALDMISQKDVINEGDSVITSGLGGAVPKSLYVGKIGKVKESADKLFQQAEIVSSVDFSKLDLVFIIKGF
ncbi:MAG: rod shape-determining protein MreC [Parcubacteria group bacterium]